jgi:hypothetical protein
VAAWGIYETTYVAIVFIDSITLFIKAALLLLLVNRKAKKIEIRKMQYVSFKSNCHIIPVSILISETTSDLSFDPKDILDPLPIMHSNKLQSASITAPEHSILF